MALDPYVPAPRLRHGADPTDQATARAVDVSRRSSQRKAWSRKQPSVKRSRCSKVPQKRKESHLRHWVSPWFRERYRAYRAF